MRTYLRTGLVFVVSAVGLVITQGAWAQDAGEGGLLDGGTVQNCDPTTLWCSNGEMGQKVESNIELPSGIDTHWMPACPGNPDLHCSEHKLQVRAKIAFTPLDTGAPVYSVDMPAKFTKIDATWPDTDFITLGLAKGKSTDAVFKVAHGMTPSFTIYMDTPVFKGEIELTAQQLLPLLPEVGQKFNYVAMNTTKFAPWGFDAVSMTVKGTDLQASQLLAVSFEQLGKLVGTGGFNDIITGSFSLNAVTNSTFTYQTTSMTIQGAEPITSQTSTTKLMGPFEDAMDFAASTKGILRYSGEIEVLPVIHITSIGSFGIKLDFPISVGVKHKYDSGSFNINFPNAPVHIPLPNVWVPTTKLDFGPIEVGQQSQKTVTIDNTGELGALLTQISCTHSSFKVGAISTQIEPGGEYKLTITFKPSKAGKYNATCAVHSNDPDSPIQTFDVSGGQGEEIPPDTDAGIPPEDAGYKPQPSNPGAFNSPADSGCGCRTSPGPSGFAVTALAMLGLGLALLRRNRRG
jgi:MYXO-CTERM domain-containing protein